MGNNLIVWSCVGVCCEAVLVLGFNLREPGMCTEGFEMQSCYVYSRR